MAQQVYVVEYCSCDGEHSAEGVYVSEDIARAYIQQVAKEYLDGYDGYRIIGYGAEHDVEADYYRIEEGRAIGGEPQLFIQGGKDQLETWTIYRTELVDTMPEEIK